jgi:hypothetical protein
MLDLDVVMRLIGRWSGTMKFFPSDPEARIGIADEIADMASDEDQVRWLVKRVPKLYREWPAMHEIRSVFCSKFKPRDGLEASSDTYLDGIPSENQTVNNLLAGPETRQIAGAVEDPDFPSDVFSLLREAAPAARRCTVDRAPLPTAADIASIKAQQDANRKESKPSPVDVE